MLIGGGNNATTVPQKSACYWTNPFAVDCFSTPDKKKKRSLSGFVGLNRRKRIYHAADAEIISKTVADKLHQQSMHTRFKCELFVALNLYSCFSFSSFYLSLYNAGLYNEMQAVVPSCSTGKTIVIVECRGLFKEKLRSCFFVWRHVSGHSCISCQTAAGWTDWLDGRLCNFSSDTNCAQILVAESHWVHLSVVFKSRCGWIPLSAALFNGRHSTSLHYSTFLKL